MNISRNDPCPCGSGQRYKKCCGSLSHASATLDYRTANLISDEHELLVGLFHAGRYAELENQSRLLISRHPNSGLAWKLLGTALGVQGKDAFAALQRAVELSPEDAYVHNNLGNALQDLGRIHEAVASYQRALKINPDFAIAQYNLGISLRCLGLLDEAVVSYRKALEIKPDYAEAHNNLGKCLLDLGRLDEAVASLRIALGIKPDCLDANRAYLTTLLYQPGISVEKFFEEHVACADRLRALVREVPLPFTNQRETSKKIRIGYVSSDFRDHPVGRNIWPLLEQHDRSKHEIYLYADVKRADEMSDWFERVADCWRLIAGLSDQSVAELIRRDEIDILVLLAGRFDDNRPLIAMHRTAPVQVSFHDPATSGIKAMDYLITDTYLSPRDTKEKFTERLVHLPTFYVHQPLRDVPGVSPLPALKSGSITFGSFNNPSKVNERVVALWSRVLHAVPNSRLALKYKKLFGNDSVRQHYLGLFLAHGIEAHRLDLVGASENTGQHMARYAEIDIALDTFPFTGSTTTFEALWMGVPVVTLLGDHMVARWSGAMLKKLKLDELIAHNEDEYVRIAQRLAQDIERLVLLRAGLRERVANSPLCDEKGRARQLERAYRWMWAKWCKTQAA